VCRQNIVPSLPASAWWTGDVPSGMQQHTCTLKTDALPLVLAEAVDAMWT
jgi:hypothetical protein